MARKIWLACLGMGAVLSGGCEQLQEVLDVKAPEAALNRVDLVKKPTVEELAGWGCEEVLDLGIICDSVNLRAPPKNKLQFSFDVVFDLSNPNEKLVIPLVETLLGFTAFEEANLGAVCVSFCDPDEEDCTPGLNVEGACEAKKSDNVDEPADLIPTVEDLVGLAQSAADGSFDNGAWRVIAGGETIESHIQFDLGIDPMLQISDELIEQAVDDVLKDRPIKLDIPYSAEGSLFFDVPELGRKAIGFGPFDDVWKLK